MADVRTTIHYSPMVVPPRCRKPRRVQTTVTVDLPLQEVTGDEAPVAFRVPDPLWDAGEYRWWQERIYTPYRPWSQQSVPTIPGSDYFPLEQTQHASYDVQSEEEAIEEARRDLSSYLVVDGEVWDTCLGWSREPRYEIYTLGLGHNHSGSGLSTTTSYNGNVAKGRYFRADQYEQAKAEAVRVATARGDTNSIPMIERTPPIQVLIPEAVRCQPALEHGDGDPFLNQIDAITAAAPDALTGGLLAIATTLKEVRS